jgi:hypothetical protein
MGGLEKFHKIGGCCAGSYSRAVRIHSRLLIIARTVPYLYMTLVHLAGSLAKPVCKSVYAIFKTGMRIRIYFIRTDGSSISQKFYIRIRLRILRLRLPHFATFYKVFQS